MRGGEFLMRARRGILAVVLCGGVVLDSAPLARPQEATSANLPERFETGEATPAPRSKKKKARPIPEIAIRASSQKPVPVPEPTAAAEEPALPVAPVKKRARVKKRAASAALSNVANFSTPTALSLSAAQALAVSAPLPEYPYQAKHANITGSGVCAMIIDTASGKVTNAMMAQSTGNAILDKVTTETFRRWRFKPGSVSQVRVPITYE
jgi:TonB family protein